MFQELLSEAAVNREVYCPVMTEGSKSRFTEAGEEGSAGVRAPNFD